MARPSECADVESVSGLVRVVRRNDSVTMMRGVLRLRLSGCV